MTSSSTWIGLVGVILFLGLMSGFWVGITGLWKARRGAAWWLMAIGVVLGTIGPIFYSVGTFMMFKSLGAVSASGSTGASPFSGFAFPVILMIGGLLIPVGLILFSVGFAIHGMTAARTASRAAELEELAVAMSEEINRLREGGPVA